MTEIKVPDEDSIEDKAHAVFRSIFGAIPFGGTAAVELFNFVVTPPLEQRKNQWMKDVTYGLLDVCDKVENLDINKLSENEEFISLLLSVSQVAIKNHNKDKITALQNAVINKAGGINLDENIEITFVNLIDQYSPLHIKLIKLIYEGFVWSNDNHKKPEDQEVPGMLVANVGSYKDLQEVDRVLIRNCLMDFVRIGLIHYWIIRKINKVNTDGSFSCELEQWNSRSRSELMVNHGPAIKADQKPGSYVVATSNFGNQFMSFISKQTF